MEEQSLMCSPPPSSPPSIVAPNKAVAMVNGMVRHAHGKAAESNRARQHVLMGYDVGSHVPSSATRAEQGSATQ